jgi:hypothetical protein
MLHYSLWKCCATLRPLNVLSWRCRDDYFGKHGSRGGILADDTWGENYEEGEGKKEANVKEKGRTRKAEETCN